MMTNFLFIKKFDDFEITFNPYLAEIASLEDEFVAENNKLDHVRFVPFVFIYDALTSCITAEGSLILFYTLVHRNELFREYVFSKSDIDLVLMPLLESCYHSDTSCNRVYMVLIILLILSQVWSFQFSVHYLGLFVCSQYSCANNHSFRALV